MPPFLLGGTRSTDPALHVTTEQRLTAATAEAGAAHRKEIVDGLQSMFSELKRTGSRDDERAEDGGWAPIDLTDERYSHAPPPPELFKRSDGVALLYPKKIHYFFGLPETAKSFAAQVAVARTLNDGGRVLYLDFENDPYSVRERLIAVGATWAGLKGLVYVNPERPWRSDAERKHFFSLLEARADLIIVDGVSNARAR